MIAVHEHWRHVRLGDVIKPVTLREVPRADGPSAFIGMEHVEPGTGAVPRWGHRSEVVSPSALVAAGDVLYGRLRPYLNKVAIAPLDAYASGEFIVFRSNASVDARFLKWRLTASDFVEFACSLNSGDRPRVKWPQMANFEFALPPLEEQRHIALALEDHLSRIDAGDRLLRSAQTRAATLGGAVAEQLLRSGQFEAIPLSHLLKPGSSGRLVDQGWSPQCERFPARTTGDWGVLKTTAIQFGGFVESENKQLPSRLEPRPRIEVHSGDLLMTRAGPRARCGVSCLVRSTRPRLMLSDKMYRLRPDVEAIDPEYLSLFLSSPSARRTLDNLKTGISDSGVNLTHDRLLTLMIPVPDRPLQSELVKQVEMVSSQAVRLRQAGDSLATRASGLRRSLLAAAFLGHLAPQTDHLLEASRV